MSSTQHTITTNYLGKAAEDLDGTGTELKVIVPELTPSALSGTFAAGTTQSNVTLKNLSGGTINAAPTTANHIIAVWESTSNHAYPPMIKKGEQVYVFKYGDSDRYYWKEQGRDRELRGLDRHRIEVSATPSLNATKTDQNTYFVEMDATKGSVTIQTNKANGEPFAYVIRIDAKNGTVLISDDASSTPNRIFLSSGASGGTPTVQLNNSKNASLILLGEDIIINAPRDIMMKAGRQIVETANIATMNWNIGRINGTTLGVASSESMVVQSPTLSISGNTKTTGMAVAQTMRSGAYYTGGLGSAVTLPTTTPSSGTGAVGGNTADGTVPSGQRHAAAYENMVTMASIITTWFSQVESRIGVPSVDQSVNTAATTSEMQNNAGA